MGVFESLSPQQQELIEKHLTFVIEANKHVNLTRIDGYDKGMILHVEDSLLGLPMLNCAPSGLYGDLGSGAGYPGIPLAIATGRNTTLIDARKKKMDVISDYLKSAGLSHQISTFAGRAELLARTQSKRYAALTARALSQLDVLLELASPLLMKRGILLCYKAQLSDEELEKAELVQRAVGMKLVEDKSLSLDDQYQRRILVFEKVAEPQIKLPRLEGQAQKEPLSSISKLNKNK